MRILITVPWGERVGGAETLLQTLIDGGGEDGHELELVFFEQGAWVNALREEGLRVEVIPAGRLREAGRYVATVRSLARLLRERRPDAVVNWMAKTQLYGAPAATLAGMAGRVVWIQHMIPRRGGIDSLATLLPAVAVGCNSQSAAAAQRRLRPRRPTFVIGGGSPAPPADEPAAPLALPAGVPVLGIVGRLQPWKGQDRLLRALAILRSRGRAAHLLIVGGDSHGFSPEYARSLQPLALHLGVAEAVTLTGEVPDAGPYIRRMDVLVNASDPEPLGLVIMEGMARGVPVVAVDAGGGRELLEPGRSGALAGSGEPQALADAIEPLLASEELRRRLGAGGKERFAAEFTAAALRRRFFERLGEALTAPE
jgi:glycosyltransferase involved in cell wall biosynthesis